jgi:hypothetical protein
VTVEIFCSLRGVGHTHQITRFEPSHHRADIDGHRFWINEDTTMSAATAAVCEGRLKPVKGGAR